MKPKNQICTVANYLYADVLRFEEDFELSEDQLKLVSELKRTIEQSVGHAKYSTQVLASFKGSMEKFFDDSEDYVKLIKKESKRLKGKLKLEDIDFEKPEEEWSKYLLVEHYETAYKLVLLIEETLTDPKAVRRFGNIKKTVERGYYLSYRICRKVQEYTKDYSVDSKKLEFHSKKFKKLNLQRHQRKLVKEEGDLKHFSDGSIWNSKDQTWIVESKNPLEPLWEKDG